MIETQNQHRPEQEHQNAPHSRRGHWHHFWTGAKDKPEERKLVLKWVAPTMIHGDQPNETTTVVKIKGE